MNHPNTESHSSNDRLTVGFLLLSFPCIANISFTHVLDAWWRMKERAVTQTGLFPPKQHCLFLPLPAFSLPCATLFCIIILAKCVSRSWFRSASWRRVCSCEITRARMTVQMHDSVMAQQPEAKLTFKQMHVRTHAQLHDTHLVKLCFYLCMVFWCKWPAKHLNGSFICISNSFDSSSNRQSSVKIINALISLYVHLQCFDILKRAIFVYMSFTKVDLDFGNSSMRSLSLLCLAFIFCVHSLTCSSL